jgi:ABC-2 type transport system ATP-binding protein
VDACRAAAQAAGFVPGDVNLWPNLTAASYRPVSGAARRKARSAAAGALFARFELDPSKNAGTYSKGNRQKVALVAAFASDAECISWTSPQAASTRDGEGFPGLRIGMKPRGKSVLLSSHIITR